MKADIHPAVHTDTRVICSCGNTFTTTSAKQEIHAEVCHKCHPFFTGEHRFLDVKGRVENFQNKQKAAEAIKIKYQAKKDRQERGEFEPKSLKELLGEI